MTTATPALCPGVGQPVAIRQFVAQPCPSCGKRLEPLLSFKVRRHEPPKRKEGTPDMPSITIDKPDVHTRLREGWERAGLTVTANARMGARGRGRSDRYPVPSVGDFFVEAADLEAMAADLVERHPDTFGHLNELRVRCLWKAKAGKKSGKVVFGKTLMPSRSSLLGHYERADFVIWLAADAVQKGQFTYHQVEALLFHELLHTAADEEGNRQLVPHDFEGFKREIEEYGFWDQDVRGMARAFQSRMRIEETGEIDDEDEG